MRQVVQNYRSGELSVEDVPVPVCKPGGVVVRVAYSLVSAGTERMKVSQARMNLVQMARARPDKVRQVAESVRQVGLKETVAKVRERMDTLTPLGYSLSGTVVEVGPGLDEFTVGDRVACAGEAVACHAEFVAVPRNLCAAVPDGVEMPDAAFATVGAIAMNGVRQAGVTIGDSVLVIGLGLVGLLAVQILKAAGCRVIGVDLDPARLDLARRCGAEQALARDDAALEDSIQQATDGLGVDVAYVAASTKSADPMELSGRVVRDRGKVVIVGMVPVEADWQTYYGKELSVIMSRSYGPGRYDPNFERTGIDYPVGYVRWTLRRNLSAFLSLIESGQVTPTAMKPETFDIGSAPQAYKQLHESPGKHAVGILFRYPLDADIERTTGTGTADTGGPNGRAGSNGRAAHARSTNATIGVGLIGAGNFTTATLIPAIKCLPNVNRRAICSAGGLSARSAARRHGFAYAASDYRELLDDRTIDAVVIGTHHDTHARFAAEAARAGKHVFVEKPLALTPDQLDEVIAAQAETGRIIMPGFNRRFSPLAVAVRDFFAQRSSPIEIVCRVNAGTLKADSWYQDAEEGGWRIISEGCHFVDLIQFLCGCPVVRTSAEMIGGHIPGRQNDNCTAMLKMADGSLGVLVYVANGDPRFEKERIEVFGQGRVGVIKNWHRARLMGGGRTKVIKGADKGHRAEMAAFTRAVACGEPSPLPFAEAVLCTRTTFAIARSLSSGEQPAADAPMTSANPVPITVS
ncbi:MAG: bi-domain-containing oxidoreductase [Phycisphaerae bacterium]